MAKNQKTVPTVKASLYTRAKLRVKRLLARTNRYVKQTYARVKRGVKKFFAPAVDAAATVTKAATKAVATGRSVWARMRAALNRVAQAVVIKPAKTVGAFFARIGRRIAKTRAFQATHRLVRATLAFTLGVTWVSMFLAQPLLTVTYTIGVYLMLEVIAHGLAKLKQLSEEGYRAADAARAVLKTLTKGVYVGMQITMAGLLVLAMVFNPALAVLELTGLSVLMVLDAKKEDSFVPRWQPGTCIACSDEGLVLSSGLCRECRRMQVEEDTRPTATDYGSFGVVRG